MKEKTFDRIMATLQLIFGVSLFLGSNITFVNHGVLNAKHWFPSIMLFLMFLVCTWMLHHAVKDFKKVFKNTVKKTTEYGK